MKHRNEQCSLCVMRECILRQVAPRLAQIKRNWPAGTHQQSRTQWRDPEQMGVLT